MPLFLPPYCPEMNPIEKLWAKMKNEWSKALMKFDGETSDEKEDKVILKICELMEKYDMKNILIQ